MEAPKIKMNMDGTFRAKVLQYKSDGNTLTDKWETLAKYAEGVYYTTDDDGYGNTIHGIVFEAKGVYWWSRQALRPEELNADNIYCQKVMENRRNFEHNIMAQAEAGQYINNLQIEVMRRLGHEVAALQAAHDEYIRQREERDRLQAEEAERRERERREAEERRKAEVLADGKEKLLKHESITVKQIELIAEAVGYKIHIRTIGFMREKVTEVVMLDNDRVQVFGHKLTSRNIDGTANVMHELCARLKEQAEKQPTTPSETPQISMETAETVNVSVEGGNTAERKEIEVQTIADMVAIGESLNKGESVSFKLHLHFLWSVTITNESAEWCEEFKYSLNAKCLDNPQSFGRRYTSFGFAMLHCLNQFNENANIRDDYETLSAALNKPQNLISDFRAPQSPEAPQMTECIDEPCKLAQTA